MNKINNNIVSARVTLFDKKSGFGTASSHSVAHKKLNSINSVILDLMGTVPLMKVNSFVIEVTDSKGNKFIKLNTAK